MVSGSGWLVDGGLALREESCDEETGFQLGAGDGHCVVDAIEFAPADGQRRQRVLAAAHYLRAHLPQGADHAVHGPGP